MIYSHTPSSKALQAIADVSHTPFWLDDPAKPNPEPQLTQAISTDLLIIGAGFAGLWTALLAKEENPQREVVLVEAGEAAIGASGRNGGFMDASLTHGFLNGLARWPQEINTLHALGIKTWMRSKLRSSASALIATISASVKLISPPSRIYWMNSKSSLSWQSSTTCPLNISITINCKTRSSRPCF